MPEGVVRAQRWPHGALRAGRAAAFLTLATGVNGIITAYVPSWEPRWIYIAVVGLVAALDGWMIGLLAAAGAVVCYELMSFGAFRFVADRDALLLAAAIVAAVTARALRLAIHRPAPVPVKERPLLTGFTIAPAPPVDVAVPEVSASLRRALDEERLRSERERALRVEQENRARELLEELTAELCASKTKIAELAQEGAALRAASDSTETALRASTGRIEELERSSQELRSSLAEANEKREAGARRAEELANELRAARDDWAREERAVAELKNRTHDLANENSRLQDQLADVASAREAAIARAAAAEREAEQSNLRAASLEASRQDADKRIADLQWSQTQLRQQLTGAEASTVSAARRSAQLELLADELRASLAAAEAARIESVRAAESAADSNAQQQRAEFDQLRYRLESEWNERLARNAVELTDRLNTALMEADGRVGAARAEAAALLQRTTDLERENDAYRTQLEQTSGTADDLNARLRQLESENAAIRASAAEVRAGLESQLRDQVEERDTAIERMAVSLSVADQRARSAALEAAALQQQLDELLGTTAALENAARTAEGTQSEMQALRNQVAALAAELEEMRGAHAHAVDTSETLLARATQLENENKSLVASARLAPESESSPGALRNRISELEAEVQAARDSLAGHQMRVEAEWSDKFARSAMEITQQFRRELSAAADEISRYREEVARLDEQLAAATREHDALLEGATAEKARLDTEWNEKLQTIVTHLASDHEHDMGQATLEREEAKAEARRLSNKLSQIEGRSRDVAALFQGLQEQNEALRAEIVELRQRLDGTGASDSEWNARLAANALELTQRFNAAMATAENRVQEARRETQNLASRIKELEQINSTLRMSDQERRAAIDAEWSEKLETIVNHLASDHEADVGQAMMEREEARAEARMHAKKAEKLQRTLEDQFALLERAKNEWTTERDQLLRSIDVLRRRMGLGTYSGTTPLPQTDQPERTTPVVLVVHRDSAVRAIAKHALETSGYEVTTASDGLEAFRLATAQHPDVILAESSMPKMDGRELVQMLKSRPETAAVKIVLMADAQGESGRYSMSDFRADDFLRDPANVEALKSTLANVLGARV